VTDVIIGNGTSCTAEPAVLCPPQDIQCFHTQYRTSVYSTRISEDRESEVATWHCGKSAAWVRVHHRLVSYVQRKTLESKGGYHTGWFRHFATI